MMTVPLQGKIAAGRVALVDDEDYELVSRYRWNAARRSSRLYATTTLAAPVLMHTLIMGQRWVDHIDGDGLNNQRSNLRLATQSQNSANTGSRGGTSRFKGVCWDPVNSRWVAQITTGNHARKLGRYMTEELAARAYDAAALAAWGEYARLNFPPPASQ